MSPAELEQAVARATGESRREIRRRGFQPQAFDDETLRDDGEAGVVVVDWDALHAQRPVLFPVS